VTKAHGKTMDHIAKTLIKKGNKQESKKGNGDVK
jgi:hypothetical protein